MLTLNIVAWMLDSIFDQTDKTIQQIELVRKISDFLNADIMTKIKYQFQSFARDYESNHATGMKQELLTDVKLLGKDSMMPKGIDKQSEEIDKVGSLGDSILKPKKKGLNNTRSSFNRSNIHSVNGSQRNSKLSAYSRKKKQEDLNLISLGQPTEDPQTANLWRLKDIQIDIRQKQRKSIQDKKKHFEQKKQNFLKELSEKQYTFDFEGDVIGSVQDEQKINYHSIKMKLSLMDRKLRSNIKFKDRENSTELKVNRKISSTLQEVPTISVEFAQIPLFQTQGQGDPSALFGIPSDIEKYKLKDFKKHYGGRFTRLDKSLNTIDLITQKNDEYNNLFSQRRYFKDEQRSINQSIVSYRTRLDNSNRRKLALPKIHGKYSTLDRYQHS